MASRIRLALALKIAARSPERLDLRLLMTVAGDLSEHTEVSASGR